MGHRFFELVSERTVIFDGAMGTEIQALKARTKGTESEGESCPELLNLTWPEAVEEIHRRYLEAGADVIETNTFGANVLVLREFGLERECRRINREAAGIARRAIERAGKGAECFVAGAIGPGTKLISLGQVSWGQMLESYREQVRGLVEGGVDLLLIETVQDPLQAKCALCACLDVLEERGLKPVDATGRGDVPIMVQLTMEKSGTMLVGTNLAAAVAALEGYPIISLGLNCGTGPGEMREHVRWLSRWWERFISVQPNAGLPEVMDGRAVYPLGAEEFGRIMREFVEGMGVEIVGGCCGTGPGHIRELVRQVRGWEAQRAVAERPGEAGAAEREKERRSGIRRKVEVRLRACSSLYEAVEYRQETSILNIGERMNASGSKAFRAMLEKEDWEGMVSLARQQVREGSHVLDVNVDVAGRDGARDMRELIPRLVRQVNVPLMIDSTRLETIEAALECAGGKCIINSANLEEGEGKFRRMVRLAQRYGAGLVVGTIDDDPQEPMARTAERKLAVARRMYELAVREMGLDERDLFIDPLVLPVSTGMEKDRRSAAETIEAVRRIRREFPECQVVVGLSNVSFGLKPEARVVLNSVFLHELIQAGLTAAILHVSRILPRNRIEDEKWEAALEVIYDRREKGDPLQRFIGLFEGKEAGETAAAAREQKRAGETVEARLRRHIVEGEREGLEATLEEALKKYRPMEIINAHLLEGMREVGELFGAGKMQLPFVLQSAEVMKAAVSYLERYMERKEEAGRKGTIVLATVKGDVHDIGKNLVDIILRNNGYTVHNLGIKQPLEAILEKWRETKADAIGLSGLLVKSVQVMGEYLEELNRLEERPVVLVGGAALSRHYAEGQLRKIYRGRLYYGRDAFEGLRIMDHLVSGRAEVLEREIQERLRKRAEVEEKVAVCAREEIGQEAGLQGEQTSEAVPAPPFWGSRVVEEIDVNEVYRFVNKVALFRGQWQYRQGGRSEEEYRRQIEEEVEPIFERLCRVCREEKILEPKVVYGYFPANSRGDELVVFDPGDPERELVRFRFPRQRGGERLCLSDYFLAEASGRRDVVAVQCVTVGPEIGRRAREYFQRDEYREYLYWHGFAVECAEALAELWHRKVREELGIAGEDGATVQEILKGKYRGKRYSLGYPACPELRDQEKIFALLKPERIGCRLTENWQIEPEESTSAIIVHRRGAKYFSV